MSIQNWNAYKNNLWDWGVLRGCFGDTMIEPTDIDGFVERNGYKLFLETKAPGVPVKFGQKLALQSLVRPQDATLIIIWGTPGNPTKLQWVDATSEDKVAEPASLQLLQQWVSHWFSYVDSLPPLR